MGSTPCPYPACELKSSQLMQDAQVPRGQAMWTFFSLLLQAVFSHLRPKPGGCSHPAIPFVPRNLSGWGAIKSLCPPGRTHLSSLKPGNSWLHTQQMFQIPSLTQECLCFLCQGSSNYPSSGNRTVAYSSLLKVAVWVASSSVFHSVVCEVVPTWRPSRLSDS